MSDRAINEDKADVALQHYNCGTYLLTSLQ